MRQFIELGDLYPLYVEKGLLMREIAEIKGVSKSKVLKEIHRQKIKTRPKYKFPLIKPNLNPSEDLAYCLGAILGDGQLTKYTAYLYTTDKDFAKAVLISLKRLKLRSRVWKRITGKKPVYIVWTCSKLFCDWCKSVSLTDFILKSLEAIKIAFIRGFFDAEGSVWRHKKYLKCRIYNTNLKLLNLTKSAVESLGFNTNIYIDKDEKWRSKPKYSLSILGGTAKVVSFINLIRPNIKRKRG